MATAAALSQSMNLYDHVELVIDLAGAFEEVTTDEEAAELHEALLDAIHGTRSKVDNCARALASMKASMLAAREEADSQAKRAARFERAIERLKSFVLDVMVSVKVSKLEGYTSTLRRQKNPAHVSVPEPARVPQEFWTQPPPPPPYMNLAEISRRLRSGEAVPGCQLQNGYHLRGA